MTSPRVRQLLADYGLDADAVARGKVIGATDAIASDVVSRPVSPKDLHGTIYRGLLMTNAVFESATLTDAVFDNVTADGLDLSRATSLKPFTQADGGAARKFGGIGLGLAIAIVGIEFGFLLNYYLDLIDAARDGARFAPRRRTRRCPPPRWPSIRRGCAPRRTAARYRAR